MTNIEKTQKQSWIEEFNTVVALYYVLKSNSASLRVKQATYRADEVAAEPIDFIIDVEVKVKRLLGQPYYDLFLRAVYNENTDILPEDMREALGRLFQEYRLGPDGPYAKLFFKTKNDQVRSYMNEVKSGRDNADSQPGTIA
jgi:hypothetical protein